MCNAVAPFLPAQFISTLSSSIRRWTVPKSPAAAARRKFTKLDFKERVVLLFYSAVIFYRMSLKRDIEIWIMVT